MIVDLEHISNLTKYLLAEMLKLVRHIRLPIKNSTQARPNKVIKVAYSVTKNPRAVGETSVYVVHGWGARRLTLANIFSKRNHAILEFRTF